MNAIEILNTNGINTEEFNKNYTLTQFQVKNYEVEVIEEPEGFQTKIFRIEFENPTNHPYACGIREIECCNEGGEFEIYNF